MYKTYSQFSIRNGINNLEEYKSLSNSERFGGEKELYRRNYSFELFEDSLWFVEESKTPTQWKDDCFKNNKDHNNKGNINHKLRIKRFIDSCELKNK